MNARNPLDRLVLLTRYPEAGKVKTRLVPALGPEGAADLQRRMTEHTLARVLGDSTSREYDAEIRYEGGGRAAVEAWLGTAVACRSQGEGDLGARMRRAFREAFDEGARRVVLIGTDCPDLGTRHVREAFAGLEAADLVLGPARDGGYYLIAARRDLPDLFEGIEWGRGDVLERTLRTARASRLEVRLLETLADVDRPEDLPLWEARPPSA